MTTQDPTRELAIQLANTFIERKDVKAVQNPKNGSYRPDGRYVHLLNPDRWECQEYFPWKLPDLLDHLNGVRTYGHYLVSTEGLCKVFVLDIDLKEKGRLRDWDAAHETFTYRDVEPRTIWNGPSQNDKNNLRTQLRCLGEGLALRAEKLLGIKTAFAYSGNKGVHVYGLLGTTDAATAMGAAVEVLESFETFEPARGKAFWKHVDAYDSLEIEIFPKQEEVKEGHFGNLVRLPLGIHRKSGQAAYFIDTNAGYEAMVPDDNPMLALTAGSFR